MTLQQSAIAMAILALLILYVIAQIARCVNESRADKRRAAYSSYQSRPDARCALGRFNRNNSRG